MSGHEAQLRRARYISSIAATLISLACGTNYVYSAWAPQYADKLHLSATQSNAIGLAGNMGMYSLGVPVGYYVDKSPRPVVLVGAILLGIGYFPFRAYYDSGSGSFFMMCLFSFLTGFGGCMAFAAAVKTSALNWPHHRGTATAFPLAAFGLSAFFFSAVGSALFDGNTSNFLMLLAAGTSGLTFLGFFFLRVLPPTSYHAVPVLSDSQRLRRTSSEEAKIPRHSVYRADAEPDIQGWNLVKNLEFWQLFTIMAILSGIGLMTINNIGHDANALWKHWDDSVDERFLVSRQRMHVSILSIGSFAGRLLSGIGSDFLVKVLRASRIWCLVIASFIFCVAQVCALKILNPNYLWLVSSLSGLGYGFLFGVFPSIVAETFGIHGLSMNWGFMTLSPVISGNIFNLFYGWVFDRHSIIEPGGERSCPDGVECYYSAYVMTLVACGLGCVITLGVIRHQYLARLREVGKSVATD